MDKDLILEGVKTKKEGEITYYHIRELKKLNPYIKCDVDTIRYYDDEGYIKLSDVTPMTEFDKKILEGLKNNK